MVRADLETDAAALLRPDWLAAQRWYGANDRQLTSVLLTDAAPLPAAHGGATTAEAWLLVITARFADDGDARYLVPAIHDGHRFREPGDGEGAWSRIASAILDGAVLDGSLGTFRSEHSGGGALGQRGDQVPERRLGVEQTNTSVLLGDDLILKVYRRLQDGVNPEIEVGAFLESVACDVVPRMAGSMEYLVDNGRAAAGMLQERVVSSQDAWHELGTKLSGDDGGPTAAVESAGAIGLTTARLHAGLASRPQDLAFPVREAEDGEVRAWQTAAIGQVEEAASAAEDAPAGLFSRVRSEVEAAYRSMRGARVTRIHGDYHLGQLLQTANGYAVIDLEGEPRRPLAERRAPQPPERDLAGMLRSFDYAARTEQRRSSAAFDADAWLARARDAFLSRYAADAPAPPDPRLLSAFELEKACYEITYEAANRPDWLWLPLEAIKRLADAAS